MMTIIVVRAVAKAGQDPSDTCTPAMTRVVGKAKVANGEAGQNQGGITMMMRVVAEVRVETENPVQIEEDIMMTKAVAEAKVEKEDRGLLKTTTIVQEIGEAAETETGPTMTGGDHGLLNAQNP